MFERRQHVRRRTLLDGRLEIAKLNGWAHDCSVRNLSATGARVAISGDVVVPEHVGLAISGAPARPARLVWYREGHAGFVMHEASEEDRARDRLAARVAAIVEPRAKGHFTHP